MSWLRLKNSALCTRGSYVGTHSDLIPYLCMFSFTICKEIPPFGPEGNLRNSGQP